MLRMFNADQVGSAVRAILIGLGGYVVGSGWMSGELWLEVVASVTTVVVALWGVWANNDKNLVKSAANVPAVHKIETNTQQLATDIPSPKVVTK